MSILEEFIEIPAEHESNIFGQFDAYAKKIERTLHVTLIARDGNVKILGEAVRVNQAKRVLEQLMTLSKRGNTITEQNVDYDVLICACLLHDIGRKEQFENPNLCHGLHACCYL